MLLQKTSNKTLQQEKICPLNLNLTTYDVNEYWAKSGARYGTGKWEWVLTASCWKTTLPSFSWGLQVISALIRGCIPSSSVGILAPLTMVLPKVRQSLFLSTFHLPIAALNNLTYGAQDPWGEIRAHDPLKSPRTNLPGSHTFPGRATISLRQSFFFLFLIFSPTVSTLSFSS